ncbi:hypothetical protein [Ohtaekwangia koreensis]|uniref:Uncharacterized protein n=1 Tax=Ohtaekwangia koreensis TaxID=688867 RepID=A0A1T5M7D9_9BACT|nr:hypothetical protein [Ohtaekwangia koreensis]SKC83759.1 hypothetical protein SAMN05660236_4539 [Ohtaekwangia koreensis]
MTDVIRFHILAHILISFTGALLLLAIWYNISDRFKQILQEDNSPKRVDKGLLYLSLAIFVWVVAGCWAYLGNEFNFSQTLYFKTGNNLFSIVNDLFLFLALCYADHAPQFIHKHKSNSNRIVVLIFIMALLTCIIPLLLGEYNDIYGVRISALPDLILSGFLTFLLIVTFYRTFANRGLQIVAVISVIAIVFIFVSILPDVFPDLYDDFTKDLIKITAKTSFIAITLVLTTSWVIQLASTPKPNEMMISFMDWSLIKITIPSKEIFGATIEFGSKTTQYINLLKFAIRRKHGNETAQSILIGLGGEINNQTYLSRIIDNMNEILKLEDDQKLDRKDLFTFIGQGKYRLRIIPENIKIDETLLREFINSPENQVYKSIVT